MPPTRIIGHWVRKYGPVIVRDWQHMPPLGNIISYGVDSCGAFGYKYANGLSEIWLTRFSGRWESRP